MGKVIAGLMVLAMLSLAAFPVAAAGPPGAPRDDLIMHLHHMHTLMDHSLDMVLEASNLLMVSRMHGSDPLAQISGEHGRKMMAEGKETLREVLSGKEMKAAHEQGRWNEPLMGYTHELGAALLAVVDDLEKMDAGNVAEHQRQMVLNHALQMAAQGSNLVMLAKMKMGGAFDQRTEAHGCTMISDARALWGKATAGTGAQRPAGAPQRFVQHGEKVLTLLEKMSALQY